jgi:hypothetical protein
MPFFTETTTRLLSEISRDYSVPSCVITELAGFCFADGLRYALSGFPPAPLRIDRDAVVKAVIAETSTGLTLASAG